MADLHQQQRQLHKLHLLRLPAALRQLHHTPGPSARTQRQTLLRCSLNSAAPLLSPARHQLHSNPSRGEHSGGQHRAAAQTHRARRHLSLPISGLNYVPQTAPLNQKSLMDLSILKHRELEFLEMEVTWRLLLERLVAVIFGPFCYLMSASAQIANPARLTCSAAAAPTCCQFKRHIVQVGEAPAVFRQDRCPKG